MTARKPACARPRSRPPGLRPLHCAHWPRLDHVALAIATLDDEPAAGDPLATLDEWGAEVARRGGGSAYAGMDALEGLLARQLGFAGDRDDYDHPHNSFLPRVVARRRPLGQGGA